LTAPWSCANGAAFNLSNPLLPQRPLGWTSADAAGLPIYPGLVKVEEVKQGVITHAIRFTSRRIWRFYSYPAGHLVTGREHLAVQLLLHKAANNKHAHCMKQTSFMLCVGLSVNLNSL
jgi:hypothetical protein